MEESRYRDQGNELRCRPAIPKPLAQDTEVKEGTIVALAKQVMR
jgi:hypothetical protein